MNKTAEWKLDGAALAAHVHGAVEIDDAEGRVKPLRLPVWTRTQCPEPVLELMSQMSAGVRIGFRTNATRLTIIAQLTGLQFVGKPRRAIVLDLVLNGQAYAQRVVNDGHTLCVDPATEPPRVQFVPGGISHIDFDDLPAGEKSIEIWLPQSAICALECVTFDVNARVEVLAPRRRWVHYGSSISHGMDASSPSCVFTAIAAAKAGFDLTSLGFAAQCMIDGFVARTIRDLNPDLITVKLGINVVAADAMLQRIFVPLVHAFIDTIRETLPLTRIGIISPVSCPMLEHEAGPLVLAADGYRPAEFRRPTADEHLCLDRVRALLAALVAQRRKGGDQRLVYLDGRAIFGPADAADLDDGLHPNARAQLYMGDRFHTALFGGGGLLSAV